MVLKLMAAVCLGVVVGATGADAQTVRGGLPPMDPAAVPLLTRDPGGRVTVRATRIATPLRIDGRLDEDAYTQVPAITDFIQQEPVEGAPVSEKTEAWILYDDENIYLTCRCWDTHPERIVANDMRRDSPNLNQHDSFGVQFDTFNDGRGGFFFYMSPIGGARDAVTTDARTNTDWNTVWDWKASRFEGGWIAEMAIPFKSLRYSPGREQTWGIQIRRLIRSKNERVHLTNLSPAWGSGAWNRMALAARLVGLQAPASSLNLELKPYGIGSLVTDRTLSPETNREFDPDAGFDLKYGVTRGLTFDLTYNTDFAQVEADEAQVNLTRFGLTFPEKREFFLEGAGIFTFGSVSGAPSSDNPPLIFYSRRIGITAGRPLAVIGGARLTGKVGGWTVGALNIEVDDAPAVGAEQTNFTVVRVQRNVLSRSSVGGIYTRRSASTVGPGANEVYGVDASFGLQDHLNLGAYLARSSTPGLDGDDLNYRAQLIYRADRYGLTLDRQVVEDNFNPEVGFLRREDFRRSFAEARFSPRTSSHPLVRKWNYVASVDYITDNHDRLESRQVLGEFQADLHSSDSVTVRYERLHESLLEAFVLDGVSIPPAGYSFSNLTVSHTAGQQHRLSGTTSLARGGFYGGTRTTAEFNGRIELSPRFGIEPNISLNWIDLPLGAVTSTVVGSRSTFTVTPRMFVAALVQYSSNGGSVLSNLRFRWEYRPGSELFLVYTEGRTTLVPRRGELQNRGLVLKINRLFRF